MSNKLENYTKAYILGKLKIKKNTTITHHQLEKGISNLDDDLIKANYDWMLLEMYDQTVRNSSGGQREFVGYLAKAAVSTGIAGVFLETHPDPDKAPCDGPNMIPFGDLKRLVYQLKEYDILTKKINLNQ